jgi:adenylyltransferase/sulfurtransferase
MEDIQISTVKDPSPEIHGESQTIVITDPQVDRYNSFGFISWWKQDVIRKARIMVIGAGALGNEVLKNLALMGVGEILIIDFDTIDDSNLSRSILYRGSDNGRKKAEVAAEAVQEINPDVATQWLHLDINHALGLGVYRRMDVVIGCLDNREARLSINQSCWKLNKPWIDGAIQELLGIARVFRPFKGACYECTLTDEDHKVMSIRQSCNYLAHENVIQGKVPTTPTISSIIAAIQSQEALKLLHGMDVDSGKALVVNGLNNDIYTMEYIEKGDCQSHVVWDPITELTQATIANTTLREIVRIATSELGEGTKVTLPAFVEKATCKKCGYTKRINKPRNRLTFEGAHCPKCGELMDLSVFEYADQSLPNHFMDYPLVKIGYPRLAVIEARNPEWKFAFYEITGDAKDYFNFERNNGSINRRFYQRRKLWLEKKLKSL